MAAPAGTAAMRVSISCIFCTTSSRLRPASTFSTRSASRITSVTKTSYAPRAGSANQRKTSSRVTTPCSRPRLRTAKSGW